MCAIAWCMYFYFDARFLAYWETSPDGREIHAPFSILIHFIFLLYVVFLMTDAKDAWTSVIVTVI